jgi:alcohol dehydrogenase
VINAIDAFAIGRLPKIVFGAGSIRQLPDHIQAFGSHCLLVIGAQSFLGSSHFCALESGLKDLSIGFKILKIGGEPSPSDIDEAVALHQGDGIEVVVGVGGGSVLDAAKAIAGLLKPGNRVMDHLEGVGPERPYEGPATPLIAVPTTAGTGSEATKNAVITRLGPDGFKKSFRDDRLVARVAIIDPDLLASCPKPLIAANGMDAVTQLLESSVSLRANPLTDALARSGLQAAFKGLLPWYEGGDSAPEGRSLMAYAALLSGICLAQTGLGSVHGLAQPLGSFFPIPHGVVCGTLLASATEANIEALRQRAPDAPQLQKYADMGRDVLGQPALSEVLAQDGLVAELKALTHRLELPKLSRLGVLESDIERIVLHSRGSSMKTNPVLLSDAEIGEILRSRL